MTNVIQIMTPVLALFLLFLVGLVGSEDVRSLVEQEIFISTPQIFGLNYKPIANLINDYIDVGNCDKWFFTIFPPNATQETKDYFGVNKGTPWN